METQQECRSVAIGTPFTNIAEGYSGIVLGNVVDGPSRYVVAIHPEREGETCEIPLSSIQQEPGFPQYGNLRPVYVVNKQEMAPVRIWRVALGVFLGNLAMGIIALIYYSAR